VEALTLNILTVVVFAVSVILQTIVLLAALWIMIKIQKMEVKWLWLILGAVGASVFDMIPFVGRPLAIATLVVTVYYTTQAEYIDILFTVVVGYSVKFCLNLFLISMLMGKLRPDLHQTADRTNEVPEPVVARVHAPTNANKMPALTNAVANGPTNAMSQADALQITKNFTLKGVIQSDRRPLAVIDTGVKTYTVASGDWTWMMTKSGRFKIHCDQCTDNSATLSLGGNPITLKLTEKVIELTQ